MKKSKTLLQQAWDGDAVVAKWNPKEKELVAIGPRGSNSFVVSLFHQDFMYGHSFLQEMEDRGYDIKTLKFSIRKKESKNAGNGCAR